MYSCKRCGKQYRSKRSLVQHLQKEEACPCTNKCVGRLVLLKQLGGAPGQGTPGNGSAQRSLKRFSSVKVNPTNENAHLASSFEFICLGGYGGISSGNSSCYMLRYGEGNWICLDAGSVVDGIWKYNANKTVYDEMQHMDGLETLKQIINLETISTDELDSLIQEYFVYIQKNDTLNEDLKDINIRLYLLQKYKSLKNKESRLPQRIVKQYTWVPVDDTTRYFPDGEIDPYNDISAFLISHSHLDHNAGLIAMTPALFVNKSNKNTRSEPVHVYASEHILNNFKAHIFNDYTWPSTLFDYNNGANINMLSDKKDFVCLKAAKLSKDGKYSETQIDIVGYDVLTCPVQHGDYGVTKGKNGQKKYEHNSTMFFVNSKNSTDFIMYFGDVSNLVTNVVPDQPPKNVTNSTAEQKLKEVWSKMKTMYIDKNFKLKAIFLECANAKGPLFGHLDPINYITVLKMLDDELKSQPPFGLQVYVTHIKPPYTLGTFIDDSLSFMTDIQQGLIDALNANPFKVIQPEFIFPVQGMRYKI